MEHSCFYPAEILLPQGIDRTKWSVVACDQYTSQPEYWEEVRRFVGDAPSTLRITLPEIFLGEEDVSGRIGGINSEMERYLSGGVLRAYPDSLFYVERTLRDGAVRRGIVGAVDLLHYDYRPGAQSLIRATEGTVLSRIPPRVKVRRHAPLELPHVMLLIDDAEKTVIEPMSDEKSEMELLYDFPLMQDSGALRGWRLNGRQAERLERALARLADPERFAARCAAQDKGVLLFAVGDGNHSLATAKECYEQLRSSMSEQEWLSHPARYALCEVCNLHDDSLRFEPIHRVLFGVDERAVLAALAKVCVPAGEREGQTFRYIAPGGCGALTFREPASNLTVGSLQQVIDAYLDENRGSCDYVHGEEVAARLGAQPGNMAFLVPGIGKEELFPTVLLDGALPRKTFSMGHACDKRFYLEARRIR